VPSAARLRVRFRAVAVTFRASRRSIRRSRLLQPEPLARAVLCVCVCVCGPSNGHAQARNSSRETQPRGLVLCASRMLQRLSDPAWTAWTAWTACAACAACAALLCCMRRLHTAEVALVFATTKFHFLPKKMVPPREWQACRKNALPPRLAGLALALPWERQSTSGARPVGSLSSSL
jgi:hypothetical protein